MKVEQHLTEQQLHAFAQGEMDLVEFERAEQHLSECIDCCERLADEPENTLLSLARAVMTSQGTRAIGHRQPIAVPQDLLDHPRYKILEPIGEGGMGVVFKAEHRLMQRTVALKLVHPWLLANSQAVERFEREVRMAARLSHPNIVVAYDADQTDSRHFLVMEYVQGETLQQRVERDGPVSAQQACDWIMQVAAGLEHAREQGMTHRDIKPQNLMITHDGRVRILDFGLSRVASETSHRSHPSQVPSIADSYSSPNASSTGVALPGEAGQGNTCCTIERTDASLILGTPDYIAPEQIDSSATADIRADIYSLGCTFYYLLAGKAPFRTTNIAETLLGHRYSNFPSVRLVRPDLPDWIDSVLARMTAKQASERFSTPRELRGAIETAMATRDHQRPDVSMDTDRGRDGDDEATSRKTAVNSKAFVSRRNTLVLSAVGALSLMMAGLAVWQMVPKPERFLVALPADGLWYPDYEELLTASAKLSGDVRLIFIGTADRPSNVLSTSKPGIAVPDMLFSKEVKADAYDGMIFIGYSTQVFSPQSGPVGDETARLIREFQMQKKVLGGMCAGQRILAQHGAVRGKRIAPSESIRDEEITLEGGTRGSEAVIADGLVVTAASAQHAEEFLRKMVEAKNR